MKDKRFLISALFICFAGIFVFYLYPFLSGLFRTFSGTDGLLGKYITLFGNPSFLLALNNTFWFTLISVMLINVYSFAAALILWHIPKRTYFMMLVLPLSVPVISTVSAWLFIFNGVSSGLLYGRYSCIAVIAIYIWKYSGFHILIYYSGIRSIPESRWDAAALDGASPFQRVKNILIPETHTFTIFNMLFAVHHSFQIFRDIYLLFGNYPPNNMYLVQHFIQNNYVRLQYDSVLCAGYVFLGIVLLIFVPLFYKAHKEDSYLGI